MGIGVVGLGALLRFYNLGSKSLWVDEMAHYQEAGAMSSYQELVNAALSHAQPPFSWLVFRWYQRFLSFVDVSMDPDFAARLPAAIFGVLAIPVAYFFGKKLFSEKEGLIGAFLVATSTLLVWYSQEARHYSMISLLALLSMFYFYSAITENTKRAWGLYAVFSILALYTHSFVIFIMVCQAIFLVTSWVLKWLFKREPSLRAIDLGTLAKGAGSMIFVVLVFAPMLLMFGLWGQLAGGGHLTSPTITLPSVLGVWGELNFMTHSDLTRYGIATSHPASYLFVALAFVGLVASLRKNMLHGLYLLFMSLLLTLLVVVVFNYLQTSMRVRYIIFVSPPFLLLVARGFTASFGGIASHLSERLPRQNLASILPVGIAFLLFGGLSVAPLSESYARQKADFRGAARYIEDRMSPYDIIMYSDDANTRFGMQRYLTRPGGEIPESFQNMGIWYVLAYGLPPDNDQFGAPFELVKNSSRGTNCFGILCADFQQP